jgi:exodeoxyribonuclease VII large subunit
MPVPERSRYSEQSVYSVSGLARRARLHIEEEFGEVQVEGELSNFARPGSGHWYFTLKDDSAQIRCAMFAGRNRHVSITPRNGQQVLIRGRVSLYEARGDFQIIADQMAPAGEGALRAAFEALQKKLDEEGLFAVERKRALPPLPRHLTIISSATGAALRDVVHVIGRRFPALAVTLIPSQVQGEAAEASLLKALAQASASTTDVVLLTRGGGSLEDLWSFNLESVARAVAACPHPTVSAIGHQTDFTITDFVADVRAPTPSAGAELITPSLDELMTLLQGCNRRLERAARHDQRHLAARLQLASSRLQDPRAQLRQQMQLTDDLEARLLRALQVGLQQRRQQLRSTMTSLALVAPARSLPVLQKAVSQAYLNLSRAMSGRLSRDSVDLAAKVRALEAVSPLSTLARGYAVLLRDADERRQPLTSIADARPGNAVTAYLADGALEMQIQDVVPGQTLAPDV